jgi:hypothetical protein
MRQHLSTGVAMATSSGHDGSYQFLAVPAGMYRLSIAKVGFAPLRREGIAVAVGSRLQVDAELAVGDATEVLEVTAAPPLLQSSRGGPSFLVDQKKIVTLPLDGRNFVPLIALSPGVSLPPGSLLPRISGSRPRVTEYIYDGISVLQPEPGQVAFYPIVDAVNELRVETSSYSAEYGRSNGGVVMVSQKSGSNELHGTFFEFFRNEKLNARNLFAGAGQKPRFRRNQRFCARRADPNEHDLLLRGLAKNTTEHGTGADKHRTCFLSPQRRFRRSGIRPGIDKPDRVGLFEARIPEQHDSPKPVRSRRPSGRCPLSDAQRVHPSRRRGGGEQLCTYGQ